MEITSAAWRNETCSWGAEMDPNQCGAVGATCKTTLRSRRIPRACDQWGDPYKVMVSSPAEGSQLG